MMYVLFSVLENYIENKVAYHFQAPPPSHLPHATHSWFYIQFCLEKLEKFVYPWGLNVKTFQEAKWY